MADEAKPETIEIEQVLGAEMNQKIIEMDIVLPMQKGKIDHVLDVYIKDLRIESVNILFDRVVVRGEFSVKVMYIADRETSPVSVFEKKNIKFTRDIEVEGACPGMKATAEAQLEYIHHDFEPCESRRVHVAIIMKVWTKVTTMTQVEVMAMPQDPIITEPETAVPTGCESVDAVEDNEPASDNDTDTEKPTTESRLNEGIVSGSRVNLRTGPGTNYPSLQKLAEGTVVMIQDEAFGWYKVMLGDNKGIDGWIASWFVRAEQTGKKG